MVDQSSASTIKLIGQFSLLTCDFMRTQASELHTGFWVYEVISPSSTSTLKFFNAYCLLVLHSGHTCFRIHAWVSDFALKRVLVVDPPCACAIILLGKLQSAYVQLQCARTNFLRLIHLVFAKYNSSGHLSLLTCNFRVCAQASECMHRYQSLRTDFCA